jgi:hypothetical protein
MVCTLGCWRLKWQCSTWFTMMIQEETMAKKKDDIPRLHVRKGATLREIYAAYREQFTAADLQRYTVDEPAVPMEQTLAKMEAIHQEETRKRGRKKE